MVGNKRLDVSFSIPEDGIYLQMYQYATCYKQFPPHLWSQHDYSHHLLYRVGDFLLCANQSGLGFPLENILKIVSKEKWGATFLVSSVLERCSQKTWESVCLPPNKEVSNISSCGHLAHVHVAFEPRIVRGMSLCKDISQGVGRELVMDIFALCELQREDLGIVRQATPQIS